MQQTAKTPLTPLKFDDNYNNVAEYIKIPAISSSEKKEFATEFDEIQNNLSRMSIDAIKKALPEILGKSQFKAAKVSYKKAHESKTINNKAYKDMYLLAAFDKLRVERLKAGTGVKPRKRVIRGRGYVKNEHPTKKPRRHYIGASYYVDLNKLDANILCVKYASNDANVPSVKVQQITEKTKEIVNDILSNKFDERIFKLLTADEKRIVKRFIKSVKLDITINDEDEKEFQNQFEIIRGEYMAGNDSPEIKSALKRFVLEAIKENKIPRHEGYSLLYALSL